MIKEKTMAQFISIIKYVWLTIALVTIVWKGIILGWQQKASDFNNYYTAAKLIVEKEPIHKFYDYEWYQNQAKQMGIEAGAKFSPFPPITAYIFVPLTLWDSLTAKRIWLGINIFLLIILLFRVKKITTWSLHRSMLFISLFLLPISNCLNYGQLYLLISFLLVEVLSHAYFSKKPKLIGAIIGILTSLKYLPILFLGYVINQQKKYTIFVSLILAIVVPSLIIYWVDPKSFNAFFQHFQSHIQGNLPEQGQYAMSFQSVDSLLNNLFVFNGSENPLPLIDAPYLKSIIKFSLYGGIFGLLFFFFKKEQYQITSRFMSVSIIGAFIILPATASYHLLLLLWPLLYLFKELLKVDSKKIMPVIIIVIFATLNLQAYHIPNFEQSQTVNLLLHYPRLWGVLCLFLLLNFYYLKNLYKNYG
tara:strand:+ start:8356 stop:9609 length:1254 start_codon:yes stop_codon:yes gene_type:complete